MYSRTRLLQGFALAAVVMVFGDRAPQAAEFPLNTEHSGMARDWARVSVADGCDVPVPPAMHHTFYVDPVRGSPRNDGSETKPWRTLQEVVAAGLFDYESNPTPYTPLTARHIANPHAVIRSGDVVLLRSGDHGRVNLKNAYFKSFVFIRAEPGHNPIIEAVDVIGGSHWSFEGIIFESLNNTGRYAHGGRPDPDYYLVRVSGNPFIGSVDNFHFSKNIFRSQERVDDWNKQTWMEKRASGILFNAAINRKNSDDGKCLSIRENNFYNIGFGIEFFNSNYNFIYGNHINKFADDGVDYGASNSAIVGNIIENSINDDDEFHRDGFQGQPYWGQKEYLHDILFLNNVVISKTDKNLFSPGVIQGLDTFDGAWDRIVVANNVIAVNAYHGIAFYGVSNISILNNTVVSSAIASPQSSDSAPLSDEAKRFGKTWIAVHDGKDHERSSHVVVKNNIASAYALNQVLDGSISNNIIATDAPKPYMGLPQWSERPAVIGPDDLFTDFDPVNVKFDLTLKKRSAAIGGGDFKFQPEFDLRGNVRRQKSDIGAYTYSVKSQENRN